MEPEKSNGGRYINISVSKINHDISLQLKRLKCGEMSQPFRSGNVFMIVRLIKWEPVELNAKTKKALELEMMVNWLTEHALSVLNELDSVIE